MINYVDVEKEVNEKWNAYNNILKNWIECNFVTDRGKNYTYNAYDESNKNIYVPRGLNFLKEEFFVKAEHHPLDLIIYVSTKLGEHLNYLRNMYLLMQIGVNLNQESEEYYEKHTGKTNRRNNRKV